jgi:hypothetical protein
MFVVGVCDEAGTATASSGRKTNDRMTRFIELDIVRGGAIMNGCTNGWRFRKKGWVHVTVRRDLIAGRPGDAPR